jgi:hypothetical protein
MAALPSKGVTLCIDARGFFDESSPLSGAVADGGRESEGGIRAWMLGNRGTPGPSRAQAARAGVNFRREPCPML